MKILDYRFLAIFIAFFSLSVTADNPGDEADASSESVVAESDMSSSETSDETSSADTSDVEDVVVTGTRFGVSQYKSSQPITIITADDYVHIQGDARQTIDKGLRVFMNTKQEAGNNYNIEVGANANVTVQVNKGNINLLALGDSDINLKATADLNVEVGKNFNVTVGGNASETVNGKKDELVTGNNTKTGARIDLN